MFYTPQQNGVVERKHMHLLDIARTLLFHANLPTKFWGECILTTTTIINKLSVANLGWNSLFEKLFHKLPDLSHLKTIGCLAYAASLGPPKSGDKFAHIGRKSVLIGFPPNQKGYKVYDLDTHTIFLSRDVIFFEHIFPFQSALTSEISDTPSAIIPFSLPPNVELTPHAVPPSPDLTSSASSPSLPSDPPPLRKSTRQSHPPTWLTDYITLAASFA